jgi:solute:Na+ symporter, SSS family
MLNVGMLFGVALVTIIVAVVAVVSGRSVKSTQDFTVAGRRAAWPAVSGILVGALVGGSSTVGTAQAAFVYGLPAWWFTLGGGIGCLVLAIFFAKPFRDANIETLPHFLVSSFGRPMRPLISVSDSIGVFMTIPGQAASAITLLGVILHWPLLPTAALVTLLIVLYVFLGGAISAGTAGFVKLLIAFVALLIFGITALSLGGGVEAFRTALPAKDFSLFGNGFWKDFGSGFGIILGVLTTQVYVQAVITGKTIRQSRLGCVVAGIGTMVFGLGGVAVGMFMRIHEPLISPAQALPLFAQHYFPDVLSGVLIGAILITVITCAGGLALGISTMVTRDLYQTYVRPNMGDREGLLVARTVIATVVILGVLAGASDVLKLIINYSFLAFAFRANAILVPLLLAVFFPRSRLCTLSAGFGSVLFGMLANIIWTIHGADGKGALFVGLAGSVVGLLAGGLVGVLVKARQPAHVPRTISTDDLEQHPALGAEQ